MRCPGQDMRFWGKDAIFEVKCPYCGREIEFFKDDTSQKCPSCGKRVPNPKMDFGCAAYCKYAEQCLGNLPPELLAKRQDLLKERLKIAVKKVLKGDFERLEKIVRLAQKVEILAKEKKSSPGVSIMSAYLFFLSEEEREEAIKRANIPDKVKADILKFLEKLPNSPNPEDFLKEGEK